MNHLQTQLSKDMEKLWNSKNGTDVTFRVDGKYLEAHKFLLTSKNPPLTFNQLQILKHPKLSVRSSVFETMFNSSMLEATENIINITDIDYEIMEEILYYIYTDHVRSLDRNAVKIILAADKVNLKVKFFIVLLALRTFAVQFGRFGGEM